ncbi:MAG: TIGR03936 family radical SAM-associated protein [Lachnospiraceae bacterium]|nr:TIGR03936 family radical SAM-associated protein [Lachnospiraceae bacterium]
MKYRVKFTKHGVIKYIGHLDLLRYFQKAFRRTDVETIYSKGFSPHMMMSFASPLGVGMEGYGEYFDVELGENETPESVKEQLNAQMAEGIEIVDVIVLPDNFGNAMASVAASDYELEFYRDNPLSPELIEAYNNAPAVTFIKNLKSGDITVNAKEFVYELYLKEENVLFARVDSSSMNNLRPASLLQAMLALEGKDINDYPFHIVRKELYRRNNKGNLVPLGDIND